MLAPWHRVIADYDHRAYPNMETINCIFCNENSGHIVIRESGFTGRQCCACDLIYISPRPSQGEMMSYYSHGEGALKYAGQHIAIGRSKRIQARHTLNLIRRYCRRGSVLEVGAGAGHFLKEARNQGFDVFAIEPGEMDAEYISKNSIPCETVPLNKESFGTKLFDVVYHCDVISHLYEPLQEFRQIREKLVPDGLLVFETGNIGELNATQLKRFAGFQYPEHLFFFGDRSVRALLDRTGFDCLAIHRYSLGFQLRMKKVLGRLERVVEAVPASPAANEVSNAARSRDATWSGGKRRARDLWHSLEFLVRYKTGWIPPRFGRYFHAPQTLIVIARKR